MLNIVDLPFVRIAAVLLLCATAGCPGGGGGGGSTPAAGQGPVTYTGNGTAAVITTRNAARLAADVLGAEVSVAATAAAASGGADGMRDVGRRLSRSLRASISPRTAGPARAAAVPVDSTEPCDSGSVRTAGSINDNGTGTLTVTWNECRKGEDTLNGSATMQVAGFDAIAREITDATISFERLTLSSPEARADLSGSVRSQLDIPRRLETTTFNIVLADSRSRMIKAENLVFADVYDNIAAPTSYVESVSGRVFDGVHGFVDVVTETPFVFARLDQEFPGSGRIILTGAGRGHIRVTALSSTAVTLGLDLDGNDAYERTATLAWADLGGPAGDELADDDGDGMHDSWESAKGLNPSDPADAALDRDGDNASNLAEYTSGTHPGVATSVPPGTAPAPDQDASVRLVSLAGAADLVYDQSTQRIFVAVAGNPGRVVPLNPVTGATEAAIQVGIDPVRIVRSDNGQYLYVGLDGEPAVQRIDVASRRVNLRFGLGSDISFGPYQAEDLQVLPGNAQAVAASLRHRNKQISPRHAGVAIFDNGVARAARTPGHTGSNVIEFSASAATLYGYNNESTEFGLRTMRVDADGVAVTNVFTSFDGNLIEGFGVDIRFAGGRIYSTSGRIIDPVTMSLLATIPLAPAFGNSVLPDAALGRVFFLVGASSTWSLRAFDMNSLPPVELGRVELSGVNGTPGSLIRWGTKGLAFRTAGGQVYLVASASLIP